MLRWIIRTIGGLFLVLAVAALIHDLWLGYQLGDMAFSALGELWFDLHAPSLNAMQAGVQRYVADWLWDPTIVTVLLWPAVLVFLLPGLVFWVLGGTGKSDRKFETKGIS